jgi:phenylalanyl-tRNA synthetase alpha subunit
MLESGSWKTTPFKPYNFATLGERPAHSGYLHPLLKVRAEFRKVLLQMGFEEMPANRWAESSFWNFDALFQPQSHPARDAHDTFFLSHPARTLELPAGYRDRVGRAHEDGAGTGGSIGHRYRFDDGEARKNLLRTHTTAVSSRMLYELARRPGGGFRPARYFSVDRVFRNETTDATHLCEFHQVEGLVADYDLSLGDLIGTIETFFRRIGISEIRFKPAYNPYTEPSMEIFGYHPDLKKWTEIGNSGMFRPEVRRSAGPRPARALPRRRARKESRVGPAKNVPPSHRARAFFSLSPFAFAAAADPLFSPDAAPHGAAREREGHRVGPVARATDHDQVPDQEHPRPVRAQGGAGPDEGGPHLPLRARAVRKGIWRRRRKARAKF